MTAAESGSAVPAHSINFINENDARSIFFPLNKKIPDARGSNANKHFHKIRAADAKKWHARLACNGSGKKSFSGSGGAHQQYPFWNASAQPGEFFWFLQKFDDLSQLFFGLINSGDIFKRNFFGLIRHQLGAALPE